MTKNAGIVKQLQFALAGITATWRSERNFRIHVGCAIMMLIALFALRPPLLWCALCVIMAVLVMAAELLNTAIERLIDHLHPDIHPAVRVAKDCAAGAVLILSAGALVVGVMTVLVSFGVIT
jgi:diacylglycerol kinase (ATP)